MSQVVADIGPAAPQGPIPAGGATVNNISLTVLDHPGPVILIGSAVLTNAAVPETVTIEIQNAGVTIPDQAVGSTFIAGALANGQVTAVAILPQAAIGDIFTLWVTSNLGGSILAINSAQLTMIGLPAMHPLAPQAVATP